MKKILIIFFVSSLALCVSPANPNAKDLENFEKTELVDSIQSVQQVKDALKRIFEEYDQCMIGSCYEEWLYKIAELVGALDVKTGKITGQNDTVKNPLAISDNDLKLLRLIWKNCRPTNYQYWQYDSILHVSYAPSKEDDKAIRRMLGVKPKNNVQSGSRGYFSPSPHTTGHAGPHQAVHREFRAVAGK